MLCLNKACTYTTGGRKKRWYVESSAFARKFYARASRKLLHRCRGRGQMGSCFCSNFLKHLRVALPLTGSRSGVHGGRFVRTRRREPGAPQRRSMRRNVLGCFFGGARGRSQGGGGGEASDIHRSRGTHNGNSVRLLQSRPRSIYNRLFLNGVIITIPRVALEPER